MYTCVYACVCTYLDICVYLNVTRTYMCVRVSVCVWVCTCVCACGGDGGGVDRCMPHATFIHPRLLRIDVVCSVALSIMDY